MPHQWTSRAEAERFWKTQQGNEGKFDDKHAGQANFRDGTVTDCEM
jgi:hypothetical protein